MSTVVDRQSVVERAKETVASRSVFIRSTTTGVVPMERRLPDGSRNVSTCEYQNGRMVNVKHVRPLNFGTNGVQVIDPQNADDLALLKECELWLEQGDDPRIKKFGVTIQQGGSADASPIPLHDRKTPATLIADMTTHVGLIADDAEAVRSYLEAVARYEIQNKNRKKVLDAIEDLGAASGTEHGLDVVEDD